MRRFLIALAAIAALPALGAPETTTVTCDAYLGATPGTAGTVSASLSVAAVSADGTTITTGRTTTTISATGEFTLTLVPNDTLTPSGTYYDVTISITSPIQGTIRDKWQINSTPDPADCGDISRTLDVAGSTIQSQAVAYTDTAPSGSCTANEPPRVVPTTFTFYYCPSAGGTWQSVTMGGGGGGGSLTADSVGTEELDDGTETPAAGEFVVVSSSTSQFGYLSSAAALAAIGAAALSHQHDGADLTSGTIPKDRVGTDHIDAIGEIADAIRTGTAGTHLVTADAASPADGCFEWVSGKATSTGSSCGSVSGDIGGVGDCSAGTCFQSETANEVFAAPDGSSGVAAFRALVDDDIPDGITVTWATISGIPADIADGDDGGGPDSVGTSELDDGSDTPAAGEFLRVATDTGDVLYDAPATVLSDIGAAASSHTHATGDITSGTFADARIPASNVTQHEEQLEAVLDLPQMQGVLSDSQVPDSITVDEAACIDSDKDNKCEVFSDGTTISFDFDDDGTVDATLDADGMETTCNAATEDCRLVFTGYTQAQRPDCNAGNYWLGYDLDDNDFEKCENGTVSDFGTGGAAGTSVILDLADDGSNESTAIAEIAITNDTNGIVSEPTADKMLWNFASDWPDADAAECVDADEDGTCEVWVDLTTIKFDFDDDGTADATLDSGGFDVVSAASTGDSVYWREGTSTQSTLGRVGLKVPDSFDGDFLCTMEGDSTPLDPCVSPAAVTADSIGTSELDDGSDTPAAGEFLRVATDTGDVVYDDAAAVRTALGLVIGTNVQAWDTELDTLAGLAETNGNVIFAAGGAWTSDATPAIDCTDCTNIPAASDLADIGNTTLTSPADGALLCFTGSSNANLDCTVGGDLTATENSGTVTFQIAAGGVDLGSADVTGTLDESNIDANVVLDNAANTYTAGAQDFSGAASVTFAANEILSSEISTEVRSMYWDAGSFTTDGTQCADAAAVTLNGGPKTYTVICTDNDAATMYGKNIMPDGWTGGTVTAELGYVQTAADTGALHADVSMQCRGAGETIDPTYGTEVAIDDAAVTGSNGNDTTTSGAVTPAGTCAGGDFLYWRVQVDATGTTTAASTLHFLGLKLEYTTNVGD